MAGVTVAGILAGGTTGAAAAVGAGCPPDRTLESGACAAAVPTPPLTSFQNQQIADKQASVAVARQALLARSKGTSRPRTQSIGDPGTTNGGTYKMPEVASMYIWKEGEGNSKKSYTCGPSATRNMVAAMYKHRDDVYKDFGEHQFEIWEGTTTSGTAVGNIAAALNSNFSSFGGWVTHKATDGQDYLIQVANDTYEYHQPVIVNVDTEYYTFFNNKALNHFDFTYGWDTTGTPDKIYVAEEWDPIYIYGSSSYGNPYGKHLEPLIHAFNAEDHTSYHKMVV